MSNHQPPPPGRSTGLWPAIAALAIICGTILGLAWIVTR